jgi:hypothetical protein
MGISPFKDRLFFKAIRMLKIPDSSVKNYVYRLYGKMERSEFMLIIKKIKNYISKKCIDSFQT